MPGRTPQTGDPRRSALRVLNRVARGDQTLDRILDRLRAEETGMPRRDRALRHALIYGVLRWRARLDWILGQASDMPLEQIDPQVLDILRLGLFQIAFMDRVPVSAAVNTSVELTKSGRRRASGFVNAVLRQAARRRAAVRFPDPRRQPERWMAVYLSFPSWLVRRWRKRFGADEARRLCQAVNQPAPTTLRVNTLKARRGEVFAELCPLVSDASPTARSPVGILLPSLPVALPSLPAFATGKIQAQDEAAQLISLLLAPRPGETVLDACAGMGGKTGHLAQLMSDCGDIAAVDRQAEKLTRLRREMERLGVTTVTPIQADLRSDPAPDRRFDRILLDAPCSGLGVLRRNPDAKWKSPEDGPRSFSGRQLELLERVAARLRPGGILVYAVCSFEPEENEQVVDRFLDRHADFSLAAPPAEPAGVWADLLDSRGFLRTLPHRHDMDGFFAARLRRGGV